MTFAENLPSNDQESAASKLGGVERTRSIAWSVNVLAAVAICALLGVVLWVAGDVLLLIFTGLLLATLLINLSRLVESKTQLSYAWSLAVVVGGLAIALCLLAVVFATRLASEANGLFETVQAKWQELSNQIQQYPWAPNLSGTSSLNSIQNIKGDWVSKIAGWFTSSFGLLSSLLLVAFIGYFQRPIQSFTGVVVCTWFRFTKELV